MGVYNITPLPYPATQSLLPSDLYIAKKITHAITDTSITRYKYNYGAISGYNFWKIDDYSVFKLYTFIYKLDVQFHSTQVYNL